MKTARSHPAPLLILSLALHLSLGIAAPLSVPLDSSLIDAQALKSSPKDSHPLESTSLDSLSLEGKEKDPQKRESSSSPSTLLAPPLFATDTEAALDIRAFLGFDSYLDNLEGSENLWATRTLYAVRITPEIGLGLNDRHAVMLGGVFIQNMGGQHTGTPFPSHANITAYYAYNDQDFGVFLGIFPRNKLVGTYPLLFFRPDFSFFHPTVNGMSANVSTQGALLRLRGELVFDWYGGDLAKRYDEFSLLTQGQIDIARLLYLRTSGLLYHIKNEELLGLDGARNPANQALFDTQLLDYILYEAALGVNLQPLFTGLRGIEIAELSLSALGSLERKRRQSALGDFKTGGGGEVALRLRYRGFGLEESYYFGGAQMRYFHEYGERVYNGLPFYQAPSLHRLHAYYEYQNSFLRLHIGLMFYNFHSKLALTQMLTLSLNPHKIFR